MKDWKTLIPTVLFSVYFVLLLLLLLAELGVAGLERFRATNQVLLLVALLFLPFLLMALTPFVRTLTLRISGQEVHVELGHLRNELRRVQEDAARAVSTAEQALWPILAGNDCAAPKRWAARRLVIGSKLDVSQVFFAHFLADWISHHLHGVECETRIPNGGSLKNFADLIHQRIDLYVDFTGTGCQYFGLDHRGMTEDSILTELNFHSQPLGVRWMQPLGATEDYRLVMNKGIAAKYKLSTLDDLALVAPRLVFSADPEFLNRRDGYPGLVSEYNLRFKSVEPCRVTDRYDLLDCGAAHICVGYETDPQSHRKDLEVLGDPRQFFPRYAAVPLVGIEALAHHDGLEKTLNLLAGTVSTVELVELVQRITHPRGGESAADIARRHRKKVLAARSEIAGHPPASSVL